MKIGSNRFLTDSELREALGNGFNMAVFEAILQKLLHCHLEATEAIHAGGEVLEGTDEESDPGAKVGNGTKVRTVPGECRRLIEDQVIRKVR